MCFDLLITAKGSLSNCLALNLKAKRHSHLQHTI